jgi:hypothetical protein
LKKLPLIGLLIGAVVAAFAFLKRKKGDDETEDSGSASGGASSS